MFKKIRFEDIYFQTYYPLSTVEHLPNNEIIVGAENDTFENHVNDFFEYAVKKTRASENDPFYEVKQYLDEQIATRTTNIFEWWKCNKARFPTLFAMARDFLSIPATSVASEQAFSCAGRIIDESRTMLDPDTVTALMCQRNWLEVSEKFGWDL